MLSRKAKAVFFLTTGPLMKVNGVLYKWLRAPRTGEVRVHLGPGQKNYMEGWINVDANMFTGRCDVWADLRNPMPFRDASLDAVYSHHVVEHLPLMREHFRDVYRCLKPNGVYRVGGPNGDSAIRKFIEGDLAWFGDYPERRTSIGGRFENFIFCAGEHVSILTASFLLELMSDAGFSDVKECLSGKETGYPSLFSGCFPKEECDPGDLPRTLIMEGRKAW